MFSCQIVNHLFAQEIVNLYIHFQDILFLREVVLYPRVHHSSHMNWPITEVLNQGTKIQ